MQQYQFQNRYKKPFLIGIKKLIFH